MSKTLTKNITAIKLYDEKNDDEKNVYSLKSYYCSADSGNELLGLGNITIFVGQNNSGKSRLLRALFNNDDWLWQFNDLKPSDVAKQIEELELIAFPDDIDTSITNGNMGKKIKELRESLKVMMDKDFFSKDDLIQKEGILEQLRYNPEFGNVRITNPKYEPLVKHTKDLESIINKLPDRVEVWPRVYIPIMRGMRPFMSVDHHLDKSELREIDEDLFLARTDYDYFNGFDQAIDEVNGDVKKGYTISGLKIKSTYDRNKKSVFTGLDIYSSLKKSLLSSPEKRDAVRTFEEILSEYFFNGFPVALIPHIKDRVVHIKIGSEPQFPIYDLGDGIQNLIICTYNIVTQTEPSLFFIEEPELYMHPGMQRSFMTILQKYPQHQFFITTHSNHLLSLASEEEQVAIFNFRKKVDEAGNPLFKVEKRNSGDKYLLSDLGVYNSSVFLSNCTIWVEGITDRLYLKCYMEKYLESIKQDKPDKQVKWSKYKEDFHYSFVEYQGSNLVHWNFSDDEDCKDKMSALKTCGNPLLIADGDIKTKGDRVQLLEEHLKDSFYLLSVKEIENLIPEDVIKNNPKVVRELSADQLNKISIDDYQCDIGIGKYLDDVCNENSTNYSEEESRFGKPSGTIKDKIEFCRKNIAWMNDPENMWELTPSLKDLCEKIFEHIEKHNS